MSKKDKRLISNEFLAKLIAERAILDEKELFAAPDALRQISAQFYSGSVMLGGSVFRVPIGAGKTSFVAEIYKDYASQKGIYEEYDSQEGDEENIDLDSKDSINREHSKPASEFSPAIEQLKNTGIDVVLDSPVGKERRFENTGVPPRAELLLRFLLSQEKRDNMIGDLEEEFRTELLPKYGAKVARRWYWAQALRSVLPLLRAMAGRLLAAVGGWKVFSWLTKLSGG